MPIRLNCPGCRLAYTLPGHVAGNPVRCKECRLVFRAEMPKPSEEPLDAIIVEGDPPAAEGLQSKPRRVPSPPPRSKVERPGSRDSHAKASPSRPAPKKKGSAAPLIIGIVLVVLLLFCGLPVLSIGGLILYYGSDGKPVASQNKPAATGVFVAENPQPQPNDSPVMPPNVKPELVPPDFGPPLPLPEVKTPVLTGSETIKLPGLPSNVVVGGGGRFLVIHFIALKQLAVFDVTEKKITGTIPLPEPNAKFAASLDKLLVLSPSKNQIQRYDLTTRECELSAPSPIPDVKWIVMGSASNGPLLVRGKQLGFFDVTTLKMIEMKVELPAGSCFGPDHFVRASANGRVFGSWSPNTSPEGIQVMVLEGGSITTYYEHSEAGHITPGPDGRVLYTARGLFTQQIKPIGVTGMKAPYCIPADQGPFYLTLNFNDGGGKAPMDLKNKVFLHVVGDTRPLLPLSQVDLPQNINAWDRERFGNDQRFHFIASAKVLVTFFGGSQFVLHKLDVEEELAKAGTDYLYVVSQPPATAPRGGEFRYPIVAKSKKGGVTYRLDAAPKGMRVGNDGLITWDVPGDFSDADVDVILTVSDAGGQEAFHTLKLRVVEGGAVPPK